MDDQVLLPPNIEEIPPPGLALVEELDKLLLVQVQALKTGRGWATKPVRQVCCVGCIEQPPGRRGL